MAFMVGNIKIDVDNTNMNKAVKDMKVGWGSAMDTMNEATEVFQKRWSDATAGIKDTKRIVAGIMVSQAFYSLSGVMIEASAAALQFSKDMETAAISMEYFVKGADKSAKAAAYLREINLFASRTPFSTTEAISLSKYMQAMGVGMETTKSFLGVITDTAAATGATDQNLQRITFGLGQMLTKGRLANEEIRQLANANIPIYEILQEQMNLTGEQIARIGTQWVPAEKAVVAILKGLEERYAGAADRIAETMTGMSDTLKDNSLIIVQQLGANAYADFADKITVVRDALDKYRDTVTTLGSAGLVKSILLDADASGQLAEFVLTLTSNLGNLRDRLGELFVAAQPLLKVLGQAAYAELAMYSYGIQALASALTNLIKVVEWATEKTGMLGSGAELAGKGLAVLFIGYKAAKALSFVGQGALAATRSLAGLGLTLGTILPIFARMNPVVKTVTMVLSGLAAGAVATAGAFGLLDKAMAGVSGKRTGILPTDYSNAYDEYAKDMEKYNEAIAKYQSAFSEPFTNIASTGVDTFEKIADSSKKAASSVKKDWVAGFDEVYQVQKDTNAAAGDLVSLLDKNPDNPYGNLPQMPSFKFPEESSATLPEYPKFSFDDSFQDAITDEFGKWPAIIGSVVGTAALGALGVKFAKAFPVDEMKGALKSVYLSDRAVAKGISNLDATFKEYDKKFASLLSKMGDDVNTAKFRGGLPALDIMLDSYIGKEREMLKLVTLSDSAEMKKYNFIERAKLASDTGRLQGIYNEVVAMNDELSKLPNGGRDSAVAKRLAADLNTALEGLQKEFSKYMGKYGDNAGVSQYAEQFKALGLSDVLGVGTSINEDIAILDKGYRQLIATVMDVNASSSDMRKLFNQLNKDIVTVSKSAAGFGDGAVTSPDLELYASKRDHILNLIKAQESLTKDTKQLVDIMTTFSETGSKKNAVFAELQLERIVKIKGDELREIIRSSKSATNPNALQEAIDKLLNKGGEGSIAKNRKIIEESRGLLYSATTEMRTQSMAAAKQADLVDRFIGVAGQTNRAADSSTLRIMATRLSKIQEVLLSTDEMFRTRYSLGAGIMNELYTPNANNVDEALTKVVNDLPNKGEYKAFKSFFNTINNLGEATEITAKEMEKMPKVLAAVTKAYAEAISTPTEKISEETIAETVRFLIDKFNKPTGNTSEAIRLVKEQISMAQKYYRDTPKMFDKTSVNVLTFREMKKKVDEIANSTASSSRINGQLKHILSQTIGYVTAPEAKLGYTTATDAIDSAYRTPAAPDNKSILNRLSVSMRDEKFFSKPSNLIPDIRRVESLVSDIKHGIGAMRSLTKTFDELLMSSETSGDFKTAVTKFDMVLKKQIPKMYADIVGKQLEKLATEYLQGFDAMKYELARLAAKANAAQPAQAVERIDTQKYYESISDKIGNIPSHIKAVGNEAAVASISHIQKLNNSFWNLKTALLEGTEQLVTDAEDYALAVSRLPKTIMESGIFDATKVLPSGTDQMGLQGLSDFGRTMSSTIVNDMTEAIKNDIRVADYVPKEPGKTTKAIMEVGVQLEDIVIGMFNQMAAQLKVDAKLKKGPIAVDWKSMVAAQIDAMLGDMPVDIKTMSQSKFEGVKFASSMGGETMDTVIKDLSNSIMSFDDMLRWFPEYAHQLGLQAIALGQNQAGMLVFNRDALKEIREAGSVVKPGLNYAKYDQFDGEDFKRAIQNDIMRALTDNGTKAFNVNDAKQYMHLVMVDIPETFKWSLKEASVIQIAKKNIIAATSKTDFFGELLTSFLKSGEEVNMSGITRQVDFKNFKWLKAVTGEELDKTGIRNGRILSGELEDIFKRLQFNPNPAVNAEAMKSLKAVLDKIDKALKTDKRVGANKNIFFNSLNAYAPEEPTTGATKAIETTYENMRKIRDGLEELTKSTFSLQKLPRQAMLLQDASKKINEYVGQTLVSLFDNKTIGKFKDALYFAKAALRNMAELPSSTVDTNKALAVVEQMVSDVSDIQKQFKDGVAKPSSKARVQYVENITRTLGGIEDYKIFLEKVSTMFKGGAFRTATGTGKAELLKALEEILDMSVGQADVYLSTLDAVQQLEKIAEEEVATTYKRIKITEEQIKAATEFDDYTRQLLDNAIEAHDMLSEKVVGLKDAPAIDLTQQYRSLDAIAEFTAAAAEEAKAMSENAGVVEEAAKKTRTRTKKKTADAEIVEEVTTKINNSAKLFEIGSNVFDRATGRFATAVETLGERIGRLSGGSSEAIKEIGKISKALTGEAAAKASSFILGEIRTRMPNMKEAGIPGIDGADLLRVGLADLAGEAVSVAVTAYQETTTMKSLYASIEKTMSSQARTNAEMGEEYKTLYANWEAQATDNNKTFGEYMFEQMGLIGMQQTAFEELNSAIALIGQAALAGAIAGTVIGPEGTIGGGAGAAIGTTIALIGVAIGETINSAISAGMGSWTNSMMYGEKILQNWDRLTEIQKQAASALILSDYGSSVLSTMELKKILAGEGGATRSTATTEQVMPGGRGRRLVSTTEYLEGGKFKEDMLDAMFQYGAISESNWKVFRKEYSEQEQDAVFEKYFQGSTKQFAAAFEKFMPSMAPSLYRALKEQGIDEQPRDWSQVTDKAMPTVINMMQRVVDNMESIYARTELIPTKYFDSPTFNRTGTTSSYLGPEFDISALNADFLAELNATLGINFTKLTTEITKVIPGLGYNESADLASGKDNRFGPTIEGTSLSSGAVMNIEMAKLNDNIIGWTQRLPDSINIGNFSINDASILAQAGIQINSDGTITFMKAMNEAISSSNRNIDLDPNDFSQSILSGLSKDGLSFTFDKIEGSELYASKLNINDATVANKMITARFKLSENIAGDIGQAQEDILDGLGRNLEGGFFEITNTAVLSGKQTVSSWLEGVKGKLTGDTIRVLQELDERIATSTGNGMPITREAIAKAADGIVVAMSTRFSEITPEEIAGLQTVGVSVIEDKGDKAIAVINQLGDRLKDGVTFVAADVWSQLSPAASKAMTALGVTTTETAGLVMVDLNGVFKNGAADIVDLFVDEPEMWDQIPAALRDVIADRSGVEVKNGMLVIHTELMNGFVKIEDSWFQSWDTLEPKVKDALDDGLITTQNGMAKITQVSAEEAAKVTDGIVKPFQDLPPEIQAQLKASNDAAAGGWYVIRNTTETAFMGVTAAINAQMSLSKKTLDATLGEMVDAIVLAMSKIEDLKELSGTLSTGNPFTKNDNETKGATYTIGSTMYTEIWKSGVLQGYRYKNSKGEWVDIKKLPYQGTGNITKPDQMASGGIIGKHGLYEMGESGLREAVVPLDRKSPLREIGRTLAKHMPATFDISGDMMTQLAMAMGMSNGGVASPVKQIQTVQPQDSSNIARQVLESVLPMLASSQQQMTPIYVGTLIADDRGIKELEKKLYDVRRVETLRR